MQEHTSLKHFIENVCVETHLRVQDDLGDGFVRLRSEEAERRQALQDIRCTEDILIEMLRNSRDAGASQIFVALSRHGSKRSLTILDDGAGIPEHLHLVVFDPRVTSKLDTMRMDTWGVHGRGMALYSIRENSEISSILASSPGCGTSIYVETNLDKLGEKTDQSAFPSFQIQDSSLKVLGPKNLIRTACEFALENRNVCKVFLGSSTEIAAALHQHGKRNMTIHERLFGDASSLPVCNRLGIDLDPEQFSVLAGELGLDLSSRSARRIINGEINPPIDLFQQIAASLAKDKSKAESPKPIAKSSALKLHEAERRRVRIDDADRDQFSHDVREAFAQLAEKYYLESDLPIDIEFKGEGISIRIPFISID